jgi:hypothetical protein
MLRMGFLHRDISIGNVLMLDPPVTMEPFAEWTREEHIAQLHLWDGDELDKYVNLVEKLVKELDSPNQCCGFVTDGDMAAHLDGFMPYGGGERSVSMPNCVTESS